MEYGNGIFLLAGKTDTDYGNDLELRLPDMRTSEERAVSLFKFMHLLHDLPSGALNLPPNYFICITSCTEIAHLTRMKFKETDAWRRSVLQSQPACTLLKEIGINE